MFKLVAVTGGDPVMQLQGGEFHPTTVKKIRVTEVGADEDVPEEVRRAVVGMEFTTYFDGSKFGLGEDVQVGRSIDVHTALTKAGKGDEAAALCEALDGDPNGGLYTFDAGSFKFIE